MRFNASDCEDSSHAEKESGVDGSQSRLVVISGCSGGGKSALLLELGRRGYATVGEPGRRVVKEELAGAGLALPWVDAAAFVRRVIPIALADLTGASTNSGWTFFDRGLVDAVAALAYLTGEQLSASEPLNSYHRRVFLVPPWAEIYVNDGERRHSFEDARAEYLRLAKAYPECGYAVSVLPKASVNERADFVLRTLAEELND